MSKTFRSWDVDQAWLLPPSVLELVPEGHVAHFVRDTVRDSLDLSEVYSDYRDEPGQPPYHPGMMVALLLYSYCQGVYSSRKIAASCKTRVDFMAVTAMEKPNFRTIALFRKRHLKVLSSLFGQVLALCNRAGLVSLGHVALDGTKLRANASKHKSMSYSRMKKAEPQLAKEVAQWLEKAEAIDKAEDEEFGENRRGDELPDWVKSKKSRREKMREAMASLEAEAAERDKEKIEKRKTKPSRGRGRPRKTPLGCPKDSDQRNFTDPESRIMNTSEGFQQCYNAQAAVDSDHQIIVAHSLTNNASDQGELQALVDQIPTNLGRQAKEVSADAGYCSESNLEMLSQRDVQAYVATGRLKHSDGHVMRVPPPGTLARKMWCKLRQGGRRTRYRLRKFVVEPVFGQIKEARGFRRFLLRGQENVSAEWSLLATAHNLMKLAAARG
jgi:transposase